MVQKKWVYLFNEVEQAEKYCGGDWEKVRGLLGGKGANLADMTRIDLPVPPFFTVTTEACNAYQPIGKFPEGQCIAKDKVSAIHRTSGLPINSIARAAPNQFDGGKNPVRIDSGKWGRPTSHSESTFGRFFPSL